MAGNRRTTSFDMDDGAFSAALQAQFDRMKLNSKREVKALSFKVKNKAQELSPVDTGRLRNAWTNHNEGTDERGPWVDVENPTEYAADQEYGTRPHEIPGAFGRSGSVTHPGTPPAPMLRPALLEAATEWKPRIVD